MSKKDSVKSRKMSLLRKKFQSGGLSHRRGLSQEVGLGQRRGLS